MWGKPQTRRYLHQKENGNLSTEYPKQRKQTKFFFVPHFQVKIRQIALLPETGTFHQKTVITSEPSSGKPSIVIPFAISSAPEAWYSFPES